METKDYIDMLKSKSKAPIYVAMQHALCYYLFANDVPCSIIEKVMRKSRSNVYYGINQARDMLEVGDKFMQQGYDEVQHHKIRILPCTVDGNIFSRHVGYKLLIDNIIY